MGRQGQLGRQRAPPHQWQQAAGRRRNVHEAELHDGVRIRRGQPRAAARPSTWKVNKVVKNGGKASAILSLATDGSTVYASAYTYGTGNFEGVYAASSTDGTIRWLQDCHGDVYSVAPIGDVVYSVGHAHYCANIGGFPDTSPRKAWYRAMAVTQVRGRHGCEERADLGEDVHQLRGPDRRRRLINWFPDLTPGRTPE